VVELPPEIEIKGPRDDPATSESRTDASVVRDPLRADGPDLDARPIPSEEAYVAENVLATKLLISQGRVKDHDGKRVERARAYAKWRYRGYLAGEIARL
jgi:hypothetical protein